MESKIISIIIPTILLISLFIILIKTKITTILFFIKIGEDLSVDPILLKKNSEEEKAEEVLRIRVNVSDNQCKE